VWADRHHFGSFAKLRVLALTSFKRVILLDHGACAPRRHT
jgi:alpha-N-acetylglucosamine transferase